MSNDPENVQFFSWLQCRADCRGSDGESWIWMLNANKEPEGQKASRLQKPSHKFPCFIYFRSEPAPHQSTNYQPSVPTQTFNHLLALYSFWQLFQNIYIFLPLRILTLLSVTSNSSWFSLLLRIAPVPFATRYDFLHHNL